MTSEPTTFDLKMLNQMYLDGAPITKKHVRHLLAMYSTLCTSLRNLESGFSPALKICQMRVKDLEKKLGEFQ